MTKSTAPRPLRYRPAQPRLLPTNRSRYKLGEAFAAAAHPFSPKAARVEAERFFRRSLGGKLATHRHGGKYR